MPRSFIRRFTRRIEASFLTIRFILLAIAYGRPEDISASLLTLRSHLEKMNSQVTHTNRDILFATVGRALSAWSKMEELLVLIVSDLLNVHPAKAGILMYSIYNSNTWLSVIHDLFEMNPTLSPLQRRFDKISEKIRSVKDRRDQLAHHSISMKSGEERPVIKSPRSDARSKSKKQQPLSLTEVQTFTDAALNIGDQLHELVTELRDSLASSRKKKPVSTIDRHHQDDFQ